MSAVLRYEIPVDGRWHRVAVTGVIVKVGSRHGGVVEFWATPEYGLATAANGLPETEDMECRAFATGEPIDDTADYVGTTYDADARVLVWHLFARLTAEPPQEGERND